MMRDMMPDMMWGMGLGGVLVAAFIVLVLVALIKYVFFR